MKISDLKNKKIAILWFWKEWKSTLNFLISNWISDITILDKNEIENKNPKIKYISWDNYLDFLNEFDLIIKSPWISPYNSKISPFLDKITSQTEIFYSNYTWKIISITATKWKSTTTTLIYKTLIEAWYNAKIVWNIWNPVLSEISFQDNYDFIVYELSSYMLEWLKKTDYISILWNIYPDHLDWHNWFENYSKAKKWILKWSKYSIVRDFLGIKNENSSLFWETWKYKFNENKFFIDWKEVLNNDWFLLKWEHNMMNITSVLWICDIIWIDLKYLEKVCKTFSWLSHRLEEIWTYNWILFVDDAISTTPESTIEWMKVYGENIWTIFLWGLDRGYEFSKLIEKIKEFKIKNIVLFPDTWNKIKELLDLEKYNILETPKMFDAIKFAFEYTEKWKVCLLSTASPSYNLWKNFEAQWDDFKENVLNYIQK